MYLKNEDPEFREMFVNDLYFKNVVYDTTLLGWNQEFKPNVYQEFLESDEIGANISYGQFRYLGKKK
jgi:hypothetical protein